MSFPQRLSAGCSDEFPEGKIVAKIVGGCELVFIRRRGRVLSFLDQCTHQPVKLSEFGELSGGYLMCHAHAGVFDLDNQGAVVSPPPCDSIQLLKCEEIDRYVYVYI